MAHPHAAHRQTKVEHSRVAHITKGYAAGGAVHADEAEDRSMVKKMVKRAALRMDGGAVTGRADRPGRARGGRAPKGKHAKTVVNVIAGGGHPPMMAPPAAMGAPMAPPMAPPMPPRPPMAGPAPGMPPGVPPGLPPGMPPRSHGGRAYKAGGRVADGPAYREGIRNGTQVQHTDGKNDGKDIGRGKPITYKTGGKVESPQGVAPATRLPGGSGGGEARLVKEKRASRDYAKA